MLRSANIVDQPNRHAPPPRTPLQVNVQPGLITIIFAGRYDHKDLADAIKRTTEHLEFVPKSHVICDARASNSSPSIEEIRLMLGVLRAARGQFSGRWAVLVSDPLRYGLTRMAGILSQHPLIQIRPFYKVDPARAWLGVTADTLTPRRGSPENP